MFRHKLKIKRRQQPAKPVKFHHRTLQRKSSGMILHFRHPPRPDVQVTLPPKTRQVGRHRLQVLRASSVRQTVKYSKPPPPPHLQLLPYLRFFDIYMQKAKPIYQVHRRNIVKAVPDLVSIVVLNYSTLEVLKPCIGSILSKTVHPYELVVVDNASRDGSLEWARKKTCVDTVVANRHNYGWTKGNNIGINVARGKYVLLLNSDTVVRTRGWLQKMVKIAKLKTVGTVGAKLLYPDGTLQHIGGGIHKGNPYHPYNRHRANIQAAKKNRVVPYVTGACLLIKKSTIKNVGLLDEGFKLGFGDVDYGLRVVVAGLKNIVCCDAVLTHIWAYTQRKTGLMLRTSSLGRYHQKWLKRLPKIAKKVKLDWGAPYR
ncbi:hypothetical protein ES702_00742 [subsurface metagenome]